MARLPRLSLPGYPHHIIQRGNNRQSIFETDADRELMLALLHEHAKRFAVAVHAYVLMPNHFHLLVTPDAAEGISQMMQAVGRQYVRRFNNAHGRTGTLWEGRYRASILQPDRHLLACMVYLALNPVRAGLVIGLDDYRWSSHAHYLGRTIDPLLTPHALFWQLGNTPFAREARYAELVQEGVNSAQVRALTDSALSGWALGDEGFVAVLQKISQRRVVKAKPGRPSKSEGRE